MPYEIGDEDVGSLATDVARAAKELGVTGYDDVGDDDDISGYEEIEGYDDVGDDDIGDDEVGRRRRRRSRRRAKRTQRISIGAMGNRGPLRVMTLPCTAPLALVAGAVGNLVFTPNRNCVIIDLILDVYVAAAAAAAIMPAALNITNATVQGRLVNAGTGQIPLSAFRPAYGWRHKPFIEWGNCDASQSVVLSFVNNDAATTHNVSGVLFVITVP